MKKGRKLVKRLRDRIAGPKSSAGPSNSNRGSIDSAPSAHNPGPGNDAGSNGPLNQSMYCPGFHSFLADLADSAQHPDPTAPSQSARPSSSSVLDMLGYSVGQGAIAIC